MLPSVDAFVCNALWSHRLGLRLCLLPFLCVSVHTEVAAGATSDQVNIDPGTLCAWMQNYIYLHFFRLYLDLTSKKAALQLKKHCVAKMKMISCRDFPLWPWLVLWAIMILKFVEMVLWKVKKKISWSLVETCRVAKLEFNFQFCVWVCVCVWTHSVDSCLCALAAATLVVSRDVRALASFVPY